MEVSRGLVVWVTVLALVLGLGWAYGSRARAARSEPEAAAVCTRSSTQQAESGGCYGDRSWSARRHARNYRRGNYGHAPTHIRYGRKVKRALVAEILAKWPERWGAKSRVKAWHKVVRHDNCEVPPSKYVMTCNGQPGPANAMRKQCAGKSQHRCRLMTSVAICYVGAAVMSAATSGVAAAVGGGICGMQAVVNADRRAWR